ncbi:MAG: YigZ family protein [Ginsengibacter sp.]
MDHYFTIETQAVAEFKDRGSKFLAYSFPLKSAEQLKKHLQALKKEHPKAVHYCFAYRIGFDGNNFRVSDDGEPAGTAGKQILGQIDSKKLTNTLVIVVRYFGGTLLGVPGLIVAYKTAASYVLQCTPVVQKAIEINYHLQFDYTMMNDVMQIMKQYNCSVHKNEMQLFCKMEAGFPKNREAEIVNSLKNLYNLELQKQDN